MLSSYDLLQWKGGHGNRFTHDFFKFPGKFHPPLVENILRQFDAKAVIDPMAGIGTVAVEAKAAGIPSLNIDVDPVSIFFMQVKTTPIGEVTLQKAWKNLSWSLEKFRRDEDEIEMRKFRDLRIDLMRRELKSIRSEDLAKLTYWFRRYVLVDYGRINHSIYNGGLSGYSQTTRHFFLACLLSSIRRISNADPSPVSGLEITKHMIKKIKEGYEVNVFGEFERRVELSIRRMVEYTEYLKKKGTRNTEVNIEQDDCMNLQVHAKKLKSKADLILFSPPYCNAIEYWRRHRLEYLLGGFLKEEDIPSLTRKFIGKNITEDVPENPIPFGYEPIDSLLDWLRDEKRSHKAKVLWRYFADMKDRLKVFYETLPDNGHCIIIIGDSVTGGRRVPTSKTMTHLAKEIGFDLMSTSSYTIKNRVMQFPTNSHSKIQKEQIIVLQKS